MSTVVSGLKKNFLFFIQALSCSIKSAMEYKVSFLIQSIFMFINNGFFLLFWVIVFSRTSDNISGFNFDTIMYLWSIPTIAYGVAYFFFGGCNNISKYIMNGQMDSFLLQPKHPLLNILTSKCKFSAFGDLAYGIVLGLIVVKFSIIKFIPLLLFGCLGSVFYISMDIILRSISVWLGDTDTLALRYSESMITFSIYPENLFGGVIKFLLYSLIPVGYMAYIPIRAMTNFNAWQLLAMFLASVLFMGVAVLTFNKAMKHYESGNTISMRE